MVLNSTKNLFTNRPPGGLGHNVILYTAYKHITTYLPAKGCPPALLCHCSGAPIFSQSSFQVHSDWLLEWLGHDDVSSTHVHGSHIIKAQSVQYLQTLMTEPIEKTLSAKKFTTSIYLEPKLCDWTGTNGTDTWIGKKVYTKFIRIKNTYLKEKL